ncbi:Cof-type HAD-IIB family hydrolase [Enterococcus sp. 2201sp1_2201st1_B8_2201SCRN_220225]|uniref:Cof-type HAD-IIB family hydrolase n=1 Tax=unclassified Enterococcus TaxID=2608891 RepID=UPI0034A2D8AA
MIKAVVVDMDGTFLDDQKCYDQKRFMSQYQEMKQLGIKFVVASGNQYQHLLSFFPNIKDEITFIAENGAKVIDQGKLIYQNPIQPEKRQQVLQLIEDKAIFSGYRLVMSGEKGAYIQQNAPSAYRKKADYFYRNLVEVADYQDVQDVVYKFAFNFAPEKLQQCEAELNTFFAGELIAMTSGHEAIDLVNVHSGKDVGIQVLADYWGLPLDEFAAFGDNLNDFSMIKRVGHGYVVANGRAEVKAIADKIIESNNQSGVLNEIDQIIDSIKKQIRSEQNVRCI